MGQLLFSSYFELGCPFDIINHFFHGIKNGMPFGWIEVLRGVRSYLWKTTGIAQTGRATIAEGFQNRKPKPFIKGWIDKSFRVGIEVIKGVLIDSLGEELFADLQLMKQGLLFTTEGCAYAYYFEIPFPLQEGCDRLDK